LDVLAASAIIKAGRIEMSDVKTKIIEKVQAMPENVTLDDVMARIFFTMQVDAGLRELDQGQSVPHEQVKERIAKWIAE